jgi:hypothetical protein
MKELAKLWDLADKSRREMNDEDTEDEDED